MPLSSKPATLTNDCPYVVAQVTDTLDETADTTGDTAQTAADNAADSSAVLRLKLRPAFVSPACRPSSVRSNSNHRHHQTTTVLMPKGLMLTVGGSTLGVAVQEEADATGDAAQDQADAADEADVEDTGGQVSSTSVGTSSTATTMVRTPHKHDEVCYMELVPTGTGFQ
eukprot:4211268-Pyramimonas_sp.AAC.1